MKLDLAGVEPGRVWPAPKNYDGRSHVEPIRQGVPANLPILPENWTLQYRGRPCAH